MSEQNSFKLCVSYKDHFFVKMPFKSDCYNQEVRYKLDLKQPVREYGLEIAKVFSSKNNELNFKKSFVFKKEQQEEYMNQNDSLVSLQNEISRLNNFDEYTRRKILTKKMKEEGVEFDIDEAIDNSKQLRDFKITIMMNDSIVIERDIKKIYSFNPKSVFSYQFIDTIKNIVADLEKLIKNEDTKYQYNYFNKLETINNQ